MPTVTTVAARSASISSGERHTSRTAAPFTATRRDQPATLMTADAQNGRSDPGADSAARVSRPRGSRARRHARPAGRARRAPSRAASWHCVERHPTELDADRAARCGAIDREVIPSPTSTQASNGSAAASPQTPTGLPASCPAPAVSAISCRTAGCQGSVSPASSAAQPVGRHRVLRQVVRADRQEVDVLQDPVGQQRGRRHLDHHAGRQPARRAPARRSPSPRRRWRPSAPSPTATCRSLRRLRDRVELAGQQPGVARRDPQPADAERGVRPRPAGSRTSSACRTRRRGSGSRPCVRRTPRAPRRRSSPAPRRSARCRDRGSTARCGTGRRPRRAPAAASRAEAPSCTFANKRPA